ADVVPHIELRPVAQGEYTEMLAGVHAPVVDVPQLGPLVARVPLAELIAVTEDALLCPRPFLIAPAAPDGTIDPVIGDGFQQGHGLQAIAAGTDAFLIAHPPPID